MNYSTESYDQKLYYEAPNFCMDCNDILKFDIRSNKRCEECYKIKKINDLKAN